MATISCLFIVGAGFSSNAGLPLTDGFTQEILDVEKLGLKGPSRDMVKYFSDFVDKTFGNGSSKPPNTWPTLDDIYTLVDLSANTGHHLGPDYSAANLRTIRRALIVRAIRMLQQRYKRRQKNQDNNWKNLETFFERLKLENTAALSLNWDCVIEQGLARTQHITNFDYGCDARAIRFASNTKNTREVEILSPSNSKSFQILKPHGSINWLYCDACRQIYWLPAKQIELVAQTLFSKRDWETVGRITKKHKTLNPSCPQCASKALGSRFATFSFRKALDFPMHAATWKRAEALLREAKTWIFFGYSMPWADFEFKHLLKRVELSRKKKPNIILITGGSGAEITVKTYKAFFGSGTKPARIYFHKGLTEDVIETMAEHGALR